ncbi:hypothetical protein LTS18_011189 [Coniosporium uncinatum]|uniref:Uncharacterized protein n=1 Tax=Coniosporium uncinatum TaxID=93489 RepID=A0ACC3DK83_9PEZI|nr:hypothetical protein LTS18_011189 [Coniosporium uncinatum]
MLGNVGLVNYINDRFEIGNGSIAQPEGRRYRRVTHASDPVPLLPPAEWGYRPHAGEIYISGSELPPKLEDVAFCNGNQDEHCIAGSRTSSLAARSVIDVVQQQALVLDETAADKAHWWADIVPDRFKLWQLFFAHRDYFWRLGLCVPGGDGWKWITGEVAVDEREEL